MSEQLAVLGTRGEPEARRDLVGMTLAELCTFAEDVLGERSFRGKQLFKWIYQKDCRDFHAMTDVARSLRERLLEIARISRLEERSVQRSRIPDPKTTKTFRDPIRSQASSSWDKLLRCTTLRLMITVMTFILQSRAAP